MGPTTVRLGGGVTGAARNQTALTWNCLVSIRAGPIQAWPKAETTRLTNESIKLHFKQPIKINEIRFKFNPRRLHHGHLSFARLSLSSPRRCRRCHKAVGHTVSVINAHASGEQREDKREIISSK